MFTSEQLNVIAYCAHECDRQTSGEISVYDLLNAWNFAFSYTGQVDINFILSLGQYVEPEMNEKGFRRTSISISAGWGDFKEIGSDWLGIERDLDRLLESYYSKSFSLNLLSKTLEDEFYFRYETIHPFRDGNGRTGKVLYNYLKGTLANPEMPPDYFGASNP